MAQTIDTNVGDHNHQEPYTNEELGKGFYEIMINEEQREIILKALENFPTHHHKDPEEVEMLRGLFRDLKDDDSNYYIDDEGKRRHMLHGFCL